MREVLLVIIFSWSGELVPCFGFECRYTCPEFVVEVLRNSRLIYTISCLLTLTPIDESDELYIWISPCSIDCVIWLIMEGECPYDLVLCTRISECSVYRLHSCDLTGECILLESECICKCLIGCWYEVPRIPDIPDTSRCRYEESCTRLLLSQDISSTTADRTIDTEYLAQSGYFLCICGCRYSGDRDRKKGHNQENNTKKHRKIIKNKETKTHSATPTSYCRSLTSRRVLYVFLVPRRVLTRVRGYHLPCVLSGVYGRR
jgi:hypothetical protein